MQIQKEQTTSKAILERMIRILSRRNYSKMELRRKFSDREQFPRIYVEQAIASLERMGCISDLRYAEDCIHVYKTRRYGPIRIRRKLQEKGIPQEIIARLMQDLEEETDQSGENPALDFLQSRTQRLLSEKDPLKRNAKALRMLSCRGFSRIQSWDAVRIWMQSLSPHDSWDPDIQGEDSFS